MGFDIFTCIPLIIQKRTHGLIDSYYINQKDLTFKKGPLDTRNDATTDQLEIFNKKIQLVSLEIG